MADRALILSADRYDITDEKTGVVQPLFQLWYITDYRESSEREQGSKPIKMLTTPEMFAKLSAQKLPAMFDMELRSRPGKGNTAALTVVDINFVSAINIFGAEPAKAKA
ncbi:hypothetical protein [Pseudoduganella dura]|uniref:hypothetical protein n=1 Tax=Pseudoduganella dura TaxID=321982 RepID=UPI001672ED04|nr:hypothetical protein [Pseudoduganella dura]GGY21261.1 hypothetical protein GCM10007386_57570 [Pseudoduganella dura]